MRNPALILNPRALRISQVFEDEPAWVPLGGDPEDKAGEEEADGDEGVEMVLAEDPYLRGARREAGQGNTGHRQVFGREAGSQGSRWKRSLNRFFGAGRIAAYFAAATADAKAFALAVIAARIIFSFSAFPSTSESAGEVCVATACFEEFTHVFRIHSTGWHKVDVGKGSLQGFDVGRAKEFSGENLHGVRPRLPGVDDFGRGEGPGENGTE